MMKAERDLGEEMAAALRYASAWRGKRVVIKYGGRAMAGEEFGTLIEDLVLLRSAGLRPMLVHGGGAEISTMLQTMGIEPRFVDGLRVTDKDTMRVVEMVLGGSVNKRLVGMIQRAGGRAVGLTGKDGDLLRVRPHARADELGFVGEIETVDTSLLDQLTTRKRHAHGNGVVGGDRRLERQRPAEPQFVEFDLWRRELRRPGYLGLPRHLCHELPGLGRVHRRHGVVAHLDHIVQRNRRATHGAQPAQHGATAVRTGVSLEAQLGDDAGRARDGRRHPQAESSSGVPQCREIDAAVLATA